MTRRIRSRRAKGVSFKESEKCKRLNEFDENAGDINNKE